MTFRVTRTTLRGQYEDDRCFLDWVAGYPTANARIVDFRDDPMNNGGPNDRRFYVWFHDVDMQPMKCANGNYPDLIVRDKKNGWPTEAEARAVMLWQIGEAASVKRMVDASNAEALSLKNIAAGMAGDVKEAVADVATGKAFGFAGTIAVGAAIVALGLWAFKKGR